jgi:hypothetical protein
MTERGLADLYRKPKHPTVKNKLFIRDPSDLRIKHVNSKTAAFRRDLRIRGLRSTIGATVQKVKFSINSGASFFWCYEMTGEQCSLYWVQSHRSWLKGRDHQAKKNWTRAQSAPVLSPISMAMGEQNFTTCQPVVAPPHSPAWCAPPWQPCSRVSRYQASATRVSSSGSGAI